MTTDPLQLALTLLYDRKDGFFSLRELAGACRLAPARLAGVLDALERRGHRLDRRPAHGVRLLRPVKLEGHLIERGLGTLRVGRSVLCFDEVASTNDVAFDSARQGNTDGLAVFAESQRQGRGRRGRKWISPPRANILLSVLLLERSAGRTGLPHEAVTIAAGLATAQAVQAVFRLPCTLKWPNDVLLDGRKLAGVLVELRRQGRSRCVVVGIGLNVNAAPPDERVDVPATSLSEHLGEAVERIELARALLQRLDYWAGQVEQGRLEGLHDEWLARCGMVNERLTVLCKGRRYTGRVLDVSPLEGLHLCCDDGRSFHLAAASSSIIVNSSAG